MLKLEIFVDKEMNKLILNFEHDVKWIGFHKKGAIELANLILEHAEKMDRNLN